LSGAGDGIPAARAEKHHQDQHRFREGELMEVRSILGGFAGAIMGGVPFWIASFLVLLVAALATVGWMVRLLVVAVAAPSATPATHAAGQH
jgi:hypothetical protein